MITKFEVKNDNSYSEVFNLKDIDKNNVCQIFLQEGYTLTFTDFNLTKNIGENNG